VLRRDAPDLALDVVIAAAFTSVIGGIVTGRIGPPAAALFGEWTLHDLGSLTINGAQFPLGRVLAAVVTFLLVTTAVTLELVVATHTARERFLNSADAATVEETALPPAYRAVLVVARS